MSETNPTTDQPALPPVRTPDAQSESNLETLFCGCGALLERRTDGAGECPDCDTRTEKSEYERAGVEFVQEQDETELVFIDRTEDLEETIFEHSATMYCPECDEESPINAEVRQMRAADEAGTRIYTCKVCRNTWRGDD